MNAREALHDYAHGLAEDIRENLEHCDISNGTGKCCGVAASADRIDPEVRK